MALRLTSLTFDANHPRRLARFWAAALGLDIVDETTEVDDQKATVERLVALGARRVYIGQGADADHFVLADQEGNEFCVLTPR